MTGAVFAGEIAKASLFTTTLANIATGSVSNSAAETPIGSLLVPAGSLANQGYEFHIEGSCDFTTGSPTMLFKLRFGTTGTTSDTLINTFNSITCASGAFTNIPWWFNGWVRATTAGASGTLFLGAIGGFALTGNGTTQPAVEIITSINWNNASFLSVTATWGTASTSNIARTTGGSLASLN